MPELPEVETARRGIAGILKATIRSMTLARRDLRHPIPPGIENRATGQRVTATGRHGKLLIIHLETDAHLVHLGMSGSLRITDGEATPPKHTHIRISLSNGKELWFTDPRRFGSWSDCPRAELPRAIENLGADALTISARELHSILIARNTSLRALLLDQRAIAGIGNIYVSEILWAASLHPMRSSNSLDRDQTRILANSIRSVLRRAVDAGGSSLRDHRQSDGSPGYFQLRWHAYGQHGLPCQKRIDGSKCRGLITRVVSSGRASFFCPEHQL